MYLANAAFVDSRAVVDVVFGAAGSAEDEGVTGREFRRVQGAVHACLQRARPGRDRAVLNAPPV